MSKPEQQAALVAECRANGMTAKAWCEAKGIQYQRYLTWATKVNRECQHEPQPDIRGSEELFSHTFMCVEEQVDYMSKKYDSFYDDEVALAYAVCGLKVIGILDSVHHCSFNK